MAYHVDLTARAQRDLRQIYLAIDAADVAQARTWFNKLEQAVFSLDQHPASGAVNAEDHGLRHLLFGRRPHVYRIIYSIDAPGRVVTVLHIRHGARDAFTGEHLDDPHDRRLT